MANEARSFTKCKERCPGFSGQARDWSFPDNVKIFFLNSGSLKNSVYQSVRSANPSSKGQTMVKTTSGVTLEPKYP